jgi:hypothetical protein
MPEITGLRYRESTCHPLFTVGSERVDVKPPKGGECVDKGRECRLTKASKGETIAVVSRS